MGVKITYTSKVSATKQVKDLIWTIQVGILEKDELKVSFALTKLEQLGYKVVKQEPELPWGLEDALEDVEWNI